MQIKKINPNITFVAPRDILHKELAKALDVQLVGTHTGHLWEQLDLPRYLSSKGKPPLLNLANTAPLTYPNSYLTLHDLAFFHYPRWNSRAFSLWYNLLVPRIARKARHIFTVSETMRSEIIKYYKIQQEKVSVTYNGLSRSILTHDTANCRDKDKIILSVGSFNARKNHHQLIRAFLASGLKTDYRLVIIGDKSKVFSETGLTEEGMNTSNIDILQGIADDELIAMYCKAEVVVSLSAYEGFGIPVLEGLYFGCKVLCSDIPVYRELYAGYACFCNPDDVSDVVKGLEYVVHSERSARGNDNAALREKYNYGHAANIILEQINKDNRQTA